MLTSSQVRRQTSTYSSGRDESVVGKRVDEVTSPENYALLTPLYKKVRDSRQVVEENTQLTTPNGPKHYAMKFVPILNAVSDCVQIITISRELDD